MLVKWDPYTEVEKTLDSFFRRPFSLKPYWEDRNDQNEEGIPWQPAVNVYEDKEKFSIDVQLPGIDMKDVHLSVTDQTLEIHGERKADSGEDKNGYHVREVRYGAFSRTFKLPSYVDPEKVKATYERGVLKVTVPKHEKAKVRVVEIESK
jgi:HSP20 family protein